MDGPQFKLARDPRVTWIGRILRPSSLDELPQLINVLMGEMSLVGPRPSPFRENQMCIPWRKARLSVRPGITGLWQVCRHDRSKGDFHQWIYYDLLYARHMSAWLDLKLLVATVVTLGGRGHVPLSWMISPHKYHDRRRSRREPRFSPLELLKPGA
jgi:lipopolysaccharide/colanic/teichoic acid biosynthesis glycosyltransferase